MSWMDFGGSAFPEGDSAVDEGSPDKVPVMPLPEGVDVGMSFNVHIIHGSTPLLAVLT